MPTISRRALLRSALTIAAAQFAAGYKLQTALADTPKVRVDKDPFALGVASGDPSTDGFVIWTRLLNVDAAAAPVSFEIAADENFRRVAQHGTIATLASGGHSAHVEVRGLRPGADYWYRFRCADAQSPVGHARTIALRPQRLKAALTSCQHWEQGFFSAYADAIEQGVEVFLQVGDYIYEESFGAGPDVRKFGSLAPTTLEEFRERHALYRSDPHLRRAHAFAPFIVTWDDHEVRNDYAGAHGAFGVDPAMFRSIRAAAYQAYFEHMPLRPSSVQPGGEVRLFRRITYPSLATFHVLDTRQYRDPQPCSNPDQLKGRKIIDCAEADAEPRTLLGSAQEQWLARSLADESSIWTLLTQQTLFTPMRLPDAAIWSDFWDAYGGSRRRVTHALQQLAVRNPVLLGGDLHSFWVTDVHAEANNPASPLIATEVLTSCLAARNGPAELFARVPEMNAHVRYLDNRHSGYAMLDIDANALEIDLRAVDDLTKPDSRAATLRRFRVEAGRRGVQPA